MTEITTADELQEADSLRQRGVISQEEFDTFKARLLGTSVTASVSEPEEVPPRVAEPLFPAPPDTSSGAPPEPPLSPPPSPPVEVAPAPVRSRFAKAPRSRLMIGGIGVVVLALVVTLVMFVTVIGHGGGKLTLTGAPRQIVLGAFSRTAAAKSLHMQYTYAVSGTPSFAGHKGKPVSVSMTAQGAVDLTNKSGALTFTGPGPNGKGTQVTAMRIIGPTLYLSTSGLSRVDGGKPWIHVGLAQYEQATGETGFSSFLTGNLSQSLGVLRQEVGKTTDLGPATVDGVATVHYRVMLPVTATSSSGAPVPTGASWPADVWVNGQRQLSQLRLQIPLFGVNMSVTETLSDYNSPVSVSPPPADQTANGTRLLQSGKLGQILGNSSAPSPSTTAPSATTSASREQIAASYTTVFDFANGTVSDKVAAIEAGSDLQQAIAQTVGSPIASSLSGAKIDSVADLDQGTCSSEGVSSPCARVDYDILGTIGTVVLPNNTGYATYQDGQWLVAKTTVCSVLGLLSQAGGTGTPPGC